MSVKHDNYPLQECADAAEKILADYPNAEVFQKFTCGHCGSRQTMMTPNEFHTSGLCEECDSVTDIVKNGCNYMVHFVIEGRKRA